MLETVALNALKALTEKKTKKKVFIKIIWNDNEKITLFITPNMKINSFIYDEKEGYLFYDHEGKPVEKTIPCILPEEELENGQVKLEGFKTGKLLVNNERLAKDDLVFLSDYHLQ
ncbi:hypothetical protein CIL03_15835 [Virgibacillus indicus]|uniref:Uncharacterized protein n=1 Tax=Virgibacillus indicus TaxID=2024554 RepID=A0A265N6C1_9BACI|nr:hypothetical protein [Virgibacillus indicus]OZU87562.1 hypothetical protein CIL03_15835 [Virgibacillus indicus]